MAYPVFYPFKTRHYQATTTASNTICSVAVAQRGKLVGAVVATVPVATHSAAANALDITVNGSTVSGWGALTITTSTGNGSTIIPAPTATTFLNPGDVLATVASSVTGTMTTFIVNEF